MALFDEEFIGSLPEDPKVGLFMICSRVDTNVLNTSFLYETFALIEAYISANEIEVTIPPLPNERQERLKVIAGFIAGLRDTLRPHYQSTEDEQSIANFKGKFVTMIGKSFVYEFTEGDLTKIQGLLNDLRGLVSDSHFFEDAHRRRLLKRLEKLQQELHKKQSDLDHFWGLVGDAGVAIGKFGKDAKPIVDRIREITDIVWRTQSRAEELPSGSLPPLLTHDSDVCE